MKEVEDRVFEKRGILSALCKRNLRCVPTVSEI